MKVTYIKHSSFLAETDRTVFLFDYYGGKLPALPGDKPAVIFSSHAHGDHFSPVIFDLWPEKRDVLYVLSSDIPASGYRGNRQIIRMGPGEKRTIPLPGRETDSSGICVETFRSTDEGVAFYLRADGQEIYHAGDLNDWNWPVEVPADVEENAQMGRLYRAELRKMEGREPDAAFVPLDPRLGEGMPLGILEYMEYCRPKAVFPMHFWKKYEVIGEFKKDSRTASFRDRVMDIREEGQSFDLTGEEPS